jgi:hypothetical protein
MSATSRIRVLVRTGGTGTDLFRTLVSLACQDIGPDRLEIVLAANNPALHTSREARLLHSALGLGEVQVLDARGLSAAQALNQAARDGDAEHLAMAPEGTRLHPQFLSRSLSAIQGQQRAQAVFWAQAAKRRTAFRPEQLVRRNAVGPVAVIQRTAWDILGGQRTTLEYSRWDFWLRLALVGGRIVQLTGMPASSPPARRLSPEQDGRAKALLVVHTPGAFEPDVCRWALSLLRGESWAAPFEPGVIPSPRDVAAMFAGLDLPLRPGSPAWSQRQHRSA